MTPLTFIRRWPLSVRTALIFMSIQSLLLQGVTPQPDWWLQRQVLRTDAQTGNLVEPDDYAAVNQGQLKHLAAAAVAEMNAKLPRGAGDELTELLDEWLASTTADDYAVVTQGQLKTLMGLFYERLSILPADTGYPWEDSTNADDYALANVGQVKHLFSFTVPSALALTNTDTDGDGWDDGWEKWTFGSLRESGSSDFDADGMENQYELTHQLNPTDALDAAQSAAGDYVFNYEKAYYDLDLMTPIPAEEYKDYTGQDLTEVMSHSHLPVTQAAADDYDGDGVSNGEEIQQQADPRWHAAVAPPAHNQGLSSPDPALLTDPDYPEVGFAAVGENNIASAGSTGDNSPFQITYHDWKGVSITSSPGGWSMPWPRPVTHTGTEQSYKYVFPPEPTSYHTQPPVPVEDGAPSVTNGITDPGAWMSTRQPPHEGYVPPLYYRFSVNLTPVFDTDENGMNVFVSCIKNVVRTDSNDGADYPVESTNIGEGEYLDYVNGNKPYLTFEADDTPWKTASTSTDEYQPPEPPTYTQPSHARQAPYANTSFGGPLAGPLPPTQVFTGANVDLSGDLDNPAGGVFYTPLNVPFTGTQISRVSSTYETGEIDYRDFEDLPATMTTHTGAYTKGKYRIKWHSGWQASFEQRRWWMDRYLVCTTVQETPRNVPDPTPTPAATGDGEPEPEPTPTPTPQPTTTTEVAPLRKQLNRRITHDLGSPISGNNNPPAAQSNDPPAAMNKEGWVNVTTMELYSDLNNDGQLTNADAGLVGKPYVRGASDEEKDKGTEHMFVNDHISNGAHDREDTTTDDPSEDDDDAKGIHIKVGVNTGKVWLEHPAIDALTFYKHKSCHPDEKLKLMEADPFDLEGTEQLPDTIYARCDGDLNVPDDNPQSLGDLILKYLPKSGGQYVQLAKTKLVLVKALGSTDHHQTAMDYINENNTTGYTGKVTSKGSLFERNTYYTVMFEGRTEMYGINAAAKSLKGITAVKDSADWKSMTAIINATYNHDSTTPDNGFVHKHAGEQYIRSYTDPATNTHWDQTCSVKVEPRVYLAYGGTGIFATGNGSVPTNASDGAGELKTEADIAGSVEGYTLVAFVKLGQEKLLFVASSDWSLISGETAGKFHTALKKGATASTIIHCDGGRNVALASADPTGTRMVTRIEGPAHQGYPRTLYSKTYLGFRASKPRL